MKNRNGSILIEVILSVVLIAICLTTLISGMLSGYRMTLLNRDYSQGMMFMENQLARARYSDFQGSLDNSFSGVDQSKEYVFTSEKFELPAINRPTIKLFQSKLSWSSGRKTFSLPVATFFVDAERVLP